MIASESLIERLRRLKGERLRGLLGGLGNRPVAVPTPPSLPAPTAAASPPSSRAASGTPTPPSSRRAAVRAPASAQSSRRPSPVAELTARAVPAFVQRALGAVEALVEHGLLSGEDALLGPLADLRRFGTGELLREAQEGVRRRPGLRDHIAALERLAVTPRYRQGTAEGAALDALRAALRAASTDIYLALNDEGRHLGVEEQGLARRAPEEAAAAAIESAAKAEILLKPPAPPSSRGTAPSSRSTPAPASISGDPSAPFPPKAQAQVFSRGTRAWEDGAWIKVSFPGQPAFGSPEDKAKEKLKLAGFHWYKFERAWSKAISDAARRAARSALLLLGSEGEAPAGGEQSPSEAPRIISARFASRCPVCTRRIYVNESIQYKRGSKAIHAACASSATA